MATETRKVFVRTAPRTVTHVIDCSCGGCFICVGGDKFHTDLTSGSVESGLLKTVKDGKFFTFERTDSKPTCE